MKSLVTLLLTGLAACVYNPPGACQKDLDCPEGTACESGVCVKLVTDGSVGAPCARDSDCQSFAHCTARACALDTGACVENSDCASWQSCSDHQCVTGEGHCMDSSGCGDWQDCTDHACVAQSGRCDDASGCDSWQDCSADHQCVTADGRCSDSSGCGDWQDCTGHACLAQPGRCNDASACESWQQCSTDHQCVTSPGACGDDTDCADWESCDASHACRTSAGRCASDADCDLWQSCDGAHDCVVKPGRCDGDGDCEAWESCNQNDFCVLQSGRCDANTDCASWQSCDAAHDCETSPGYCGSDSECESWQTCGTSHTCGPRPGSCDADVDCSFQDHCVDHACQLVPAVFDPNEVVIWGTLVEGSCGEDALVTPDAPNMPYVGFGCYEEAGSILPDGEVLYYAGDWVSDPVSGNISGQVATFRRDSMVRCEPPLTGWCYPSNVYGNDVPAPTTQCPNGTFRKFVVQGGTGAVLSLCTTGSTPDGWYLPDGTLALDANQTPESWCSNGDMLVATNLGKLSVRSPDGTSTPVEGLAPGVLPSFARCHDDGFWAFVAGSNAPDALWFVGPDGQATVQGTYPDHLAGTSFRTGPVLDGSGAEFEVRSSGGDLVERRAVGDSAATAVYSEADRSTYCPAQSTECLFVNIHDKGLITGP